MPERPTSSSTPPAGWYPDPGGSDQHRYWDGDAWTAHVRPAASGDPAAPPPPGGSAPPPRELDAAPPGPGAAAPPAPPLGAPPPSYPPPPAPPTPWSAAGGTPTRPGGGSGPNWTIIGVVAVVVVLLVGAVAVFAGGDDDDGGNGDGPTTQPGETTQPGNSTDPTAPEVPGPEVPAGAVDFDDPEGRWRLATDPAWSEPDTQSDPALGTVVLWFTDETQTANVNVVAETVPDGTTIDAYVEANLGNLEASDVEVVGSEPIDLSSGDAGHLLEYSSDSFGDQPLSFLAVLAIDGDGAAIVTYTNTADAFAGGQAALLPYMQTLDVL